MTPAPTRFLDLGPVEQVEYLARELAEWRAEGFRTPQFARRWMRRVRIAAAACEETVEETLGMVEVLADAGGRDVTRPDQADEPTPRAVQSRPTS